VWSPDGRSIYFLSWNDQSLSRLYRVDNSGGKPVPLPLEKGQYTELAISPDGSELALRKRSGNTLLHPDWDRKPGIYLVSVESGAMRFVSERGEHPHFGPDHRIYAQERSGRASGRGSDTASTRLISMNRSGHDVRELATARHATDIRLAPDGRHVAFLENHRLKVAAFTATGKPLPLDAAQPAFPTATVSKQGGNYLHWSGDGRRLSWSTGPRLYTAAIDDTLAAGIDETAIDKGRKLSITVQADRPDSRLALINARLITMDAERRVIENGTVLIDGNRIAAVGPKSAVPDDYTVIDLSGKTVIPGLVDIHAHGPYGSGAIIPQQNWNLLAHLALGVTTVHNPSSQAELAFAAAEYVRAGVTLGPRIFSTGEIIYGAKSPYYSPVDSLDDALAHVRRLKAQGAITVKNYNQPRREQRQQVIEAARREGLMTVAEGGSLFHQDMNLVADGTTGVEHNVPTLTMYDDVTQLWGGSDAGYTPTLVVTFGGLTAEDYYYQQDEVWKHPILSKFVPPAVLQPRAVRRPMAPESDYRDDDAAAAARVLLEAGVTVNTGAHGQREGLGTHWEMWSFTRGGFTPMEALSAATINPATYLGMAADIGSIEVGKLADLVILEANPLSDIRHSDRISNVVLNGRVYDASNLRERHTGDHRLRPFYWAGKPASAIR
jgi:imidazolonepropionase-like amidohydrolase